MSFFSFSVATNCHSLLDTRALSEHDKNRSFDKELSVLGETLFFVQLVAQVQFHHKKEGLILLSQSVQGKEKAIGSTTDNLRGILKNKKGGLKHQTLPDVTITPQFDITYDTTNFIFRK